MKSKNGGYRQKLKTCKFITYIEGKSPNMLLSNMLNLGHKFTGMYVEDRTLVDCPGSLKFLSALEGLLSS